MYSGLRETYHQSKTLLVVLKQIITGERSSKQLGSFITIAQVSGHALEVGFFAFMAWWFSRGADRLAGISQDKSSAEIIAASGISGTEDKNE